MPGNGLLSVLGTVGQIVIVFRSGEGFASWLEGGDPAGAVIKSALP